MKKLPPTTATDCKWGNLHEGTLVSTVHMCTVRIHIPIPTVMD